jgi:uncharacterized protein YaaW (UPF0174 family)
MKNPVFDKDLTTLLRQCDNSDLDPIVSIILAAPSQTLTVKQSYREHAGDHKSYIDEIIYEITSFGGNSLANLVRGHGVPYAEMVRDVAGRLGLTPSAIDTTATLEEKVIVKVLKLSYEQMSPDDRTALGDLMNAGAEDGEEIAFDDGFPEQEIGRRLGDGASSLMGDRIQNAVNVAARSTQIRHALGTAAKAVLTKVATASLGGPVSWAALIGQSVYDLFGPSTSTAIALVAHIGLIRQKQEQIRQDGEEV